MRFREHPAEELQIDLTPLIDVVFLLLIFFMVSTTFSKESQLRIKLPESAAAPQVPEERKLIEIQISSQEVFAVKGPADKEPRQLLSSRPDDLRRAIRQAGEGQGDLVVIIRADRKTPHEAVIQAMDAARRLGHTHITFATQQSLDPAKP
jgi:biopolymer transport protein ExbD